MIAFDCSSWNSCSTRLHRESCTFDDIVRQVLQYSRFRQFTYYDAIQLYKEAIDSMHHLCNNVKPGTHIRHSVVITTTSNHVQILVVWRIVVARWSRRMENVAESFRKFIYSYLDAAIFRNLISFYRAALNVGRSSREKGVLPSVRLSVKRVDCDKTEEISVQINIPYERSFSLVFTACPHGLPCRALY